MAHRAKLYHVEIHALRNRNDRRPFGNVDGQGLKAIRIIRHVLANLSAVNTQGTISISFESPLRQTGRDQVGASIFRGNSGINSAIQLHGHTVFQRQLNHSESVRAGIMFELPRASYVGTVALHVPHGMGYKSLLEEQLKVSFRRLGLSISLRPIVPVEAFQRAVLDGHVKKLTLIRHALKDMDPYWQYSRLDRGDLKRMVLVFEARRNRFLRINALERFVQQGYREDLLEVLEFGDLPFDEATVTVRLPNGTTRTFNLEGAEGGHPMSILLRVREDDDDEEVINLGASAIDLAKELREALGAVSVEDNRATVDVES